MANIAISDIETGVQSAVSHSGVNSGSKPAFLWSGEFSDPAQEDEFRFATWNETLERTRGVQIAVYVFAACFAIDFFVLASGPLLAVLAVGRFLSIPVGRIPLIFFSAPSDHKKFYAAVTVSQLYLFGVFLIAVFAGSFRAIEQSLSALMIIFAFYFGVPNRLSLNALASIIATTAFIAAIGYADGTSMRSIGLVFILLLIGNFCGIQAVRVSSRLRRAEFLVLKQQRELNEQLTVEIATRQAAERAVLVTEENFHSIFVAAPEALAIVDPSTHHIIQANRKAQDLFGEGHDLTGIDSRTLFVDQDVRHRIDEAAIGQRPRAPIEARLKTGSGAIIWAHISSALVRFHGLPAMLVALQDVTERRRESEALREARDQATDSSRSKSEFLANMSHELRTPLNAIIGFSEALERELFGPVGNPRYREYATDIHDSGVHLLNLINDILDLSKIEAGHFKLHEDEADLDGIVASACRIVRHRAQQASISIETNLPKPAVSLIVDERALKQILINLVSNAVKFSNDCGTVSVDCTVSPKGLCIAVIDRGIGIAEDDIPKALSPFTQLDGTLSRAHEGTGLGLPLAKHMTELHGGTLRIESKPGEGTTVFVDLPASCVIGMKPGLFAVS
ncbi:MAG: PAS domain-containing sensor histidine kinase [Parvibaculum sp.]|nr:PAS domain-containing sensor histidine kinase [Parvibaculum sp.]